MATPLTGFTKKDAKFIEMVTQQAFLALKKALVHLS